MKQANEYIIYEKWPLWEGETGGRSPYHVAVVILNRGCAANALTGEMMTGLGEVFASIGRDPHCRLVLLMGAGKHFSAGADIQWMAASGRLDFTENKAEALELTQMYENLANLDLPTVALVHGAACGGGTGLLACCDIVIAEDTSHYCLSEVKLGVIPAVISPYLARKMTKNSIMAYALSGSVFSASQAQACGLVTFLAPTGDFSQVARDHINKLLSTSLEAQCAFKNLLRKLEITNWRQGEFTAEAIAHIRTTQSAQQALQAFLAKEPSPFNLRLGDEANLVRRS